MDYIVHGIDYGQRKVNYGLPTMANGKWIAHRLWPERVPWTIVHGIDR